MTIASQKRLSRRQCGLAPAVLAGAAWLVLCGMAGIEIELPFEKLAANAQLALDTNRLDRAAELYEKAAARAPERKREIALDWAWTYVQKAYRSIRMGEYEEADGFLERAVEIDESVQKDVGAMWGFARTSIFSRDFAKAREAHKEADWPGLILHARTTLEITGDHPRVRYDLALALEWGGKKAEAVRQYAAALPPAAPQNVAFDELRRAAYTAAMGAGLKFEMPVHPAWRKLDDGEFQKIELPPFVVYHHNAEVAERMVQALRYFRAVPIHSGLLRSNDYVPGECRLYLHRDKDEFHKYTGAPGWSGALYRYKVVRNKTKLGEIHLFQSAPLVYENSAAHELAHLRFSANPSFNPRVPLCINEGVAVSAEEETHRNVFRKILLRARDEERLIPVRDMLLAAGVPRGSEDIFYAESLLIVETLLNAGSVSDFWKFVRTTGVRRADQALVKVYKKSTVEIENLILERIAEFENETR
jgi:tetratricopeptide (TPR) repeat protein